MGSPAILRDSGWDQASGQETIPFFIELCSSVLKRANALIFFILIQEHKAMRENNT